MPTDPPGQLLYLACGAFLLTAVGTLWRRELSAVLALVIAQGIALTAIAVVLSIQRNSVETALVAVGVGAVKVVAVPAMLRRILIRIPEIRETRPLVNTTVSLLAAAGLILLAYVAARPLATAAPSATVRATPVGISVVLIGFFLAASRSRAVSQIFGLLLVDNGIAAVAFLASGGIPLVVELGVSADIALAVGVLHLLAARMHAAFGGTDLDELRELHD